MKKNKIKHHAIHVVSELKWSTMCAYDKHIQSMICAEIKALMTTPQALMHVIKEPNLT